MPADGDDLGRGSSGEGHRLSVVIGRGGPQQAAPAPQVIEKPLVIEKIVYVEKPAPAAKRPRPTHLRAVPGMSLPFFDEPSVAPPAPEPEPVVLEPVIEAVEMPEPERLDDVMAAEDRERLEELLDELTGLKARLQTARERLI